MDFHNLDVLLLHNHPEYLKTCCKMINDEWPRSETARMMSLQASCDTLPTSLILVHENKVIGHCKLTRIPNIPESCFIESVVISKALRGKKLGTYLMSKVEEYCKNKLKLKMVHLSTKGQEDFYAKLGYKICTPVSIYGTSVNFRMMGNGHKEDKVVPVVKISVKGTHAPPPPPPPPVPKETSVVSNIKSSKTFMLKYLI